MKQIKLQDNPSASTQDVAQSEPGPSMPRAISLQPTPKKLKFKKKSDVSKSKA